MLNGGLGRPPNAIPSVTSESAGNGCRARDILNGKAPALRLLLRQFDTDDPPHNALKVL
jgi:hypothetical protein